MITAIVRIDADAAAIPEVASKVAELPGVSEAFSVTGDVDLIAMVRVQQHEDLAGVIADKISKWAACCTPAPTPPSLPSPGPNRKAPSASVPAACPTPG